MSQQLLLLDDDRAPWRLNDETRQIGRQGVADARAALAQAQARRTDDDEHTLAA